MKIGINARFLAFPYTGIGQYLRSLLSALAAAESHHQYVLFTPELVELPLPADRFRQIRLPEREDFSPSLAKAHWEHVLLPRELLSWGVDLAFFPYPSNPWCTMPFPVVVTVHDVIPWVLPEYRRTLRSRLYHWYARHALRRAQHVITVSDFSKKEIRRVLKFPEKDMTVIPLAAPLITDPTPPADLALRRPFFLYVGGYDARKNVPFLLAAFQKHIAPHTPVDLILVGGAGRGLESLITDRFHECVGGHIVLKPKGEVLFTGPLDSGELLALYRQALALVHPSLYEGFNLPLLEAMSHGLPVACSDIPVNHEVTGGHALFFDPTRVDAIGNALHGIYHDKNLRRDLTRDGKHRAKDFSWKKAAEATLEVYELFK